MRRQQEDEGRVVLPAAWSSPPSTRCSDNSAAGTTYSESSSGGSSEEANEYSVSSVQTLPATYSGQSRYVKSVNEFEGVQVEPSSRQRFRSGSRSSTTRCTSLIALIFDTARTASMSAEYFFAWGLEK